MGESKLKCYCINCGQEEEMIVTNDAPINRRGEKKSYGYCKRCCEKLCLIELF